MILTEEKARTMVCICEPMARVSGALCRASDCIAWRWASEALRWRDTGYCGLAGVPEPLIAKIGSPMIGQHY